MSTLKVNKISNYSDASIELDATNVGVGTATPKAPLDIYEMGGLTIAMTALHPTSEGTYVTTTSYVVPTADWKVTFTAPANGKVEIHLSGHCMSPAAGDDYVYVGLSDNSSYSTLGAQYEKLVWQPEQGDNIMINFSWIITGLTAGTSYTYYVGTKFVGDDACTWYWGGDATGEYQALIIKALTVPNTIYAG